MSQIRHKILIASCKRCLNSKLEVFFTKDSIGAHCSDCNLVVFEVSDFIRFVREMQKMECAECKRKKIN